MQLSEKSLGTKSSMQNLPDVSHTSPAVEMGHLDKVGMGAIEMPIYMVDESGERYRLPALIDAYVSLDKAHVKGIHMSRLYLVLKEVFQSESLSLRSIKHVLTQFIESQKGLSESSYLRVAFDLPVERKALLSDEMGWRQYPVFFEGQKTPEGLRFFMGAEVTYSSTCPCSAALARRLIQDQFKSDFSDIEGGITVEEVADWLGKESSIAATPHSQRSIAKVRVELDHESIAPDILEVIDWVEQSLGTPVQTAVKRQDEQEFARLNAQNLMFCEDAARKIKGRFEQESRFLDFHIRVEHLESLHAHNAVSEAVKG